MAKYKANEEYRRQVDAFLKGFNTIIPADWIYLFNPEELQKVISGGIKQIINLIDLRDNTVYNGYSFKDKTIVMFWEIMEELTQTQLTKMLLFTTGCERPPLLGFSQLFPKFCVQKIEAESMPKSSACFNILKIPCIENKEMLKNKIELAIEQCTGFQNT